MRAAVVRSAWQRRVDDKFLCPVCGGVASRVVDTRRSDDRRTIRRRRQCLACGSRYNTEERVTACKQIKSHDHNVLGSRDHRGTTY